MVLEEIFFGDFQDGGHLGYPNKTILAILHLPCCLPSSFRSIRHMVREDVCLKNFNMAAI